MGAHIGTAQLSPQTRHTSHVRGHHHTQSDCMCLVFKRETAEGLKSISCEVQPLRLKLVACCNHAVGEFTPTCTAEHHQPPTPIIYISQSGHGSDGLRWAAMAAIHVLACPVLQLRPHLHNTNSFPPIFLHQKLPFGIADRPSFPKLALVAFSPFGQLAQSQFALGFPSLVVAFIVGAATSWTGKCSLPKAETAITNHAKLNRCTWLQSHQRLC